MNSVRSWLLPWLIIPCALVIVVPRFVIAAMHHDLWFSVEYNYYSLTSNYFADGFVRRGLTGTLAALLGALKTPRDLFILQAFMVVWLATPVFILLDRLRRTGTWTWIVFAVVIVLSPQTFLAWSGDVGRADMLVCGFVAWALLATLSGRLFIAVAVLLAGYLAHENTIIFGAPLCSVFAFVSYRTSGRGARKGAVSLALLLLGIGLINLAWRAFGADPAAVARTITGGELNNHVRDVAAYIAASGFREVIMSVCITLNEPAEAIFTVFTCISVIVLYAYVLGLRRDLIVLTFATLIPFVAITILAIDYGRWLSFAVMNAWLSAISLRLRQPSAPAEPLAAYRGPAIAFFALFLLGPRTTFDATFLTGEAATKFWPHGRNIGLIDKCDPGWRTMVSTMVRTVP